MITTRLVQILWLDAEGAVSGWSEFSPQIINHTDLTVTYGLYVGEDEHFLYHANTFNHLSGEYADIARIPLSMVHSIETLQVDYYEDS